MITRPPPLTPAVVLPWAAGPWQQEQGTPSGPTNDSAASRTEAPRPAGMAAAGKPTIPRGDAVVAREQDVLAAAVIIDVLATQTSKLFNEPTVLADLTSVCLALLAIGNDESGGRARELVVFAAGPGGAQRAAIARSLTEVLGDGDAATFSPCSPSSVADALRRIETMARIVMREAVAILEARDTTTYHQA